MIQISRSQATELLEIYFDKLSFQKSAKAAHYEPQNPSRNTQLYLSATQSSYWRFGQTICRSNIKSAPSLKSNYPNPTHEFNKTQTIRFQIIDPNQRETLSFSLLQWKELSGAWEGKLDEICQQLQYKWSGEVRQVDDINQQLRKLLTRQKRRKISVVLSNSQ